MIGSIQAFFDKYLQTAESGSEDIEHSLQLASSALLVELIHADMEVNPAEMEKLERLLGAHFQLAAEETRDLIDLAHEEKHAATDYYRFTSLLNEHYSQAQKIRLIEYCWELSIADDRLDKFEEHLIRRLADLLHVPHADFIQAKHRVLDQA